LGSSDNRLILKEKFIINDSEINYSEIPATNVEFWEDAVAVYPQKKYLFN